MGCLEVDNAGEVFTFVQEIPRAEIAVEYGCHGAVEVQEIKDLVRSVDVPPHDVTL